MVWTFVIFNEDGVTSERTRAARRYKIPPTSTPNTKESPSSSMTPPNSGCSSTLNLKEISKMTSLKTPEKAFPAHQTTEKSSDK